MRAKVGLKETASKEKRYNVEQWLKETDQMGYCIAQKPVVRIEYRGWAEVCRYAISLLGILSAVGVLAFSTTLALRYDFDNKCGNSIQERSK